MSMAIGAEDRQSCQQILCLVVRQINDSLPTSVDVLEAAPKKSLGSNVRANDRGSSFRKYSSGVLKTIPTFVAKSLTSLQ